MTELCQALSHKTAKFPFFDRLRSSGLCRRIASVKDFRVTKSAEINTSDLCTLVPF